MQYVLQTCAPAGGGKGRRPPPWKIKKIPLNGGHFATFSPYGGLFATFFSLYIYFFLPYEGLFSPYGGLLLFFSSYAVFFCLYIVFFGGLAPPPSPTKIPTAAHDYRITLDTYLICCNCQTRPTAHACTFTYFY